MRKASKGSNTIARLHRTRDGLWISNCKEKAEQVTAGELKRLIVSGNIDEFRIVGFDTNMRLVVDVHRQLPSGEKHRVKVGTPALFGSTYYAKPASEIIAMSREISTLPGSVGGWRSLTKGDVAAYFLSASKDLCLRQADDRRDKWINGLLRSHPAWPAVSFVADYDRNSVFLVLAAIKDPRWYVDSQHPDRVSRLMSFLGVIPSNFDASKKPKYRFNNATLAARSWLGQFPRESNSSIRPDNNSVVYLPNYFLWRRMVTTNKTKWPKDVSRTTAAFWTFVRNVWLDNVTPNSELFVPDYFFNGNSDYPVDASGYTSMHYKNHALRLRQQKDERADN